MKKKYYRYIIYFLLAGIIIISVLYLSGTSLLRASMLVDRFKLVDNILDDSLTVIKLNKEAFSLRLTDPQKTIKIADSSLNIAKNIKYGPGIAEAYRVVGIGHYYRDSIQIAVKNYLEALKHYRDLNDAENQAKVYNNIGNLYRDIDDPVNALKYFEKSLAISQGLNNDELLAGLYFNIGITYEKKGKYTQALAYLNKGYKIFKRRKDTVYSIIFLQNSGLVYYKLKNFDKAELLLSSAVIQAKENKLYKVITGCSLMLAGIYIHKANYSAARKILDEGIRYSRILKDTKVEYTLLYKRYELARATKNHIVALELLSSIFKRDSLLLMKHRSQNIGITSRHYLQQQKIQEKELIITKQKYREATFRWVITLSALIVLLCAITVLMWFLLREKRRKRKEIIIQNNITSLEQKALQAMMNPHFVFNVMNSIQHFINEADSRTANQILSGFSRLARKHLEICMSSTISIQEELVYLQLYLSLEKIRFSDKMNYEITIAKNIDTEEILIPSMLIQPFIENAIWHGIMPKDEGGIIKLHFNLDQTDLLVRIIDDGIGISNSENIKKTGHISRGMELIRERVSLLNRLNKRHIFIEQQQTGDYGTEVLIRIPA